MHLLEGCRSVKFKPEDGSSTCRVSPDISSAFTLQLQKLLKTMLGAALSVSRPSGSGQSRSRHELNGSSGQSKANDVETLKKMYGFALKLTGGSDLGALHSMWYS